MMMNLFLWGLLFTLGTGIFTYTTLLTSLARTFEGLDVSLVQSAVVAIDENSTGKGVPYFDEDLLTSRIRSYFLRGLSSYFEEKDYSLVVGFGAYRLVERDGYAIRTSYPMAAVLHFRCDVIGLYTYKKERTFTIVPGERYVA
ncbi:MAG: hypothetical protein WCS90_02025 [Bacilli bacterium]